MNWNVRWNSESYIRAFIWLITNTGYLYFSPFPYFFSIFGAFAELRRENVSLVVSACMSVCQSVCTKQLGSNWTDFYEIWCSNIFRKDAVKIQVSLKSDKNNGYFTWRPMYIFDYMSLNSSYNCRENHNTFYIKGKAVPLQAWSGPESSRKLRFPNFMITAQDGGKVSLTHRQPVPPGNTPGTHFY